MRHDYKYIWLRFGVKSHTFEPKKSWLENSDTQIYVRLRFDMVKFN